MTIELASPEEQDPRREQTLFHCAADRDGDCTHPECPQLRDGEPTKSGRSCPLWEDDDDDY